MNLHFGIMLLTLISASVLGCGEKSREERTSKQQSGKPAMDWILVRYGTPEAIKQQIIEHSKLFPAQLPRSFKVTISPVSSGGYAVTFDPKPPPYAFCNLIGWLDAPPGKSIVSDATGWYVFPSREDRFALMPDHKNTSGDTLIGASKTGTSISVYLPEISICEVSASVKYKDDSSVFPQDVQPAVTFDVILDVNEKFGNPTFKFTHPKDSRW